MADDPFTETAPELAMILEALRVREPIFHRPRYARTPEDFARLMAPDFWEIGASGRRYSRAFILNHLAANPPIDAEAARWQTSDFACRSLGPDTFLLTYKLLQGDRATRRTTIWFHSPPAGKSSSTRAPSSRPRKTTRLRLRRCKIPQRSSHGNAGAYSP